MRLLDETPAVLLLQILCSKHRNSFEWKKRRNSTSGQLLEVNYLYNGQLRTSCRTRTVIIFQQQFVFNIEINGSVKLFQKIGTIIRSSNDSKWQACTRETDADRSWQAGHGKPWTSIRFFFQMRCARNFQRKVFLIGYSPSHLISRTWRCMCSHIPLIERSQIRKVMLQKWRLEKNRSTAFHSRFCKDRNCDRCLRTKNTRVLCRRRNEGSIPRAEKLGDLITAEHKVLNEGCEPRNNHRFAGVVQDLIIQWFSGYNLIRVKPKLHRRRRRIYGSFKSRHRSPMLFIWMVYFRLARLVKN